MMINPETRAAVARRRVSEAVFVGTMDASENTLPVAVVNLSRRFGISAEVANAVAQLAGLGPREARQ